MTRNLKPTFERLLLALAAFVTLAAPAVPAFAGDRGAVATIDGKEIANPRDVKDKDWLGLSFADYRGLRSRVAVVPVADRTAGGAAISNDGPMITFVLPMPETNGSLTTAVNVNRIGDLLESALVGCKRFDVVSRSEMSSLLREQGLGMSGLTTKASAAKMGDMLGAQFLVVPSIDEWVPEYEKGKTHINHDGILQGIDLGHQSSLVVMTIKVIDATTGQIMFSENVTGTASSRSISVKGIFNRFAPGATGVETESQHQGPISDALNIAIAKATYRIVSGLKDKPWQGMVAKVSKAGSIYVNAGADVGVSEGLMLRVLSRGEEITNPVDGSVIGYETEPIGEVQVISTMDKLATAKVVTGCRGIKRADLLQVVSPMGADFGGR